jgi:hypothetical protein
MIAKREAAPPLLPGRRPSRPQRLPPQVALAIVAGVGVSLAVSKDLSGVRWGALEVSGVGLFGVACIFCARARGG